MSSLIEYIKRLRQKTKYWLIYNDSKFIDENSNPFGKNKIPIMCNIEYEHKLESFEAYESGNRSILLESDCGWFKAKGIGIPRGVSQPFSRSGEVYTYMLYDDPDMCHRYILWGFMTKEEYSCELYGSVKAKELGQEIEFLGSACLDNINYITYKDRSELFDKLHKVKQEDLIGKFRVEGRKTTAYSVYYRVPSDLRVEELFFVFMFPQVTRLIDKRAIEEYVEWLGSSCGAMLRSFHESGSLHGTWVGNRATSLGLRDVHSNSYVGNYLVDEEKLTMCDFDLSKPIKKESEKEIEKWALVHIENPLHYAGSFTPSDAIAQGVVKKNPFREKLAKIFKDSVNTGYKDSPGDIEREFKRMMLYKIIKAKEFFWKIYELPRDLIGHIAYLDYLITNKKIDDNKFSVLAKNL